MTLPLWAVSSLKQIKQKKTKTKNKKQKTKNKKQKTKNKKITKTVYHFYIYQRA